MLIPLGILDFGAGVPAGVAGYWVAGNEGPPSYPSTNQINRLDFATEAYSTLAATVSVARDNLSGFADSGVAGYAAGGYDQTGATNVATVDKLAFPAEATTTLATGLSAARRDISSGMANKGVAGYVGGGYEAARVATVDKFTFPTDFRSTLATGLSSARTGTTGFANNAVAGYFGGGNSGSYVTTVDKFAFPGDTRSTLATGTLTTVGLSAGFANDGVAGYIATGFNTNNINKFAFPSDTRSTVSCSVARYWLGGFSNNGVAGYFGGGNNNLTIIEKIAFPTDTVSTMGITMSPPRSSHAGFADQGL